MYVQRLGPFGFRDFALATGLALAYFTVAGASIAAFGTNTPIWFANALAVAAILPQRLGSWPIFAAAVWGADTLAVAFFGSGPAPLIAVSDMTEVLITAGAIRWIGGAQGALSSVSGLGRFILICLLAPLPGATWGAFVLWLAEGAPFLPGLAQWYAATSLGQLAVAPILLIWSTAELRRRASQVAAVRTLILTAALAALAVLVFSQAGPAFLFITFPALLLLVWSGGLVGASAGSAVLLAIGLWLTLRGEGGMIALVLPATDVVSQVQALQVYLAALTLSSLPLAVVLEQQRELAAKLGRAAAARTEFLAAMSHEIRTPMTGVLGMVDLLAAENLTTKQRRYTDSIHASGRHLLNIINDILDFTRLESGRIELEAVDFSMPDVLERLRSMLSPLSRERGLELRFELSEHSPPIVNGDPTRIKQVLLNLTANAIKLTETGSVTVSVSHRRADAGFRFRFEVRDTGIGITPGQQADLFDAFTQADRSTTRRYGGTGLGLAISKRLVEAMEGEIGVDSAAGSGSTFWFELPLQPADEAHLPRLPGASAPLVSPRRILVAEDVEINREIVKSVLERDGHEVAFAHDGAEALRLVQESGFDLVLMDIQMPIMDGVEATRLIRSLDGPVRDIPVVALTANVMAAEQEKYIAAGMNECLMKPIDWDRMRLAIGRYSVRT